MSNYWQDRESKHIEKMLQQHVDYEKEIHRLYLNLWDEIQDEILKFYSTYAGKQNISIGEAKKAASEFDVKAFAKQAKKYVKDRDFSSEANRQLKIYNLTMKVNRLELLKSKIGMFLTGTTDELQTYLKYQLTKDAVAEWSRQAGILAPALDEPEYRRAIESIVDGSYHNATFSQRLWANQDILKADLDRLLTQGLTAGKHPNVLSRELRKLVVIDSLRGAETADYVARRLMLSEATRIQSEVQKRSYEEYGYEEYDFIPESTACPHCKRIAKAGPYKTKDMEPGENAGPIHGWCRCSTVPKGKPVFELNESGLSGSGRVGNNKVDLKYIDSPEFRSKFTRLTNNNRVNDKLRRYAQAMLTHRNGNDGEDLYIMNASTGELLKRKFGEDNELGVSLSKEELDDLRKHRGNLVAIHNHPTNVWPTGSDYAAAGYRGYRSGVVVTHDGRVFKYSAGDKPFLAQVFDNRVDKYTNPPYNKSVEEAFVEVTKELGKEYGIKCEEI